VKSSTSKKIEQMRYQLEKHFQCERWHKHVCQTNQEHENLICEKAHQNQHRQVEKQKAGCISTHSQEHTIQGEMVIYLDDAGIKHLTLLIIPKSHILLV
jgi:hypothetical protein